MKAGLTILCICALWSAIATNVEGSYRNLQQQLPTLQAPAPAPGSSGPPCTCSIASIYSGVTYCFATTATPGTNGTYSKQANPNCNSKPYACTNTVTLAPGIKTAAYPNATITGQGLQCKVNSFSGPVPAPAAPPASASAQPCITLPAGDYGPTGSINYATGPNRAPTPDCTVGSGIVCSIYIPISNGTAKICASQTAEDALRG